MSKRLKSSACQNELFNAGVPIQSTVFALIVLSVAQELALWRRADPAARSSYASYWAALASLTTAGVFSLADVTRVWCDPDDPWRQGHALWHVFSALALVLLQRFYAARPAATA